jgi:hypothetical protein
MTTPGSYDTASSLEGRHFPVAPIILCSLAALNVISVVLTLLA